MPGNSIIEPLKHHILKISFLLFLGLFISSLSNSQPRAVLPPLKKSVSSYYASSEMPSSYGINYRASNAGDNTLLSWWSPATYDRETCWLQLNFGYAKTINYISIHAGSHYPSFKNLGNLFPKNLRIRYAQLEFSDGSTESINLEDIDEVQTVYFRSKSTQYVRIRPLRYYPSIKWNDPCISYFNAGYDN